MRRLRGGVAIQQRRGGEQMPVLRRGDRRHGAKQKADQAQGANQFDDILVLASNSLPRNIADRLEPWDLKNLVPYRDEYLSGFVAESYQIDLPQGFDIARGIMDEYIRQSIVRDIGGDHQR